MGPLLHTERLSIGHGSRLLLENVDLELHRGQLCALIGINGVGKSTLLRSLAGLLPPMSGRVMIGDMDVHAGPASERARRVSVVLTGRPQSGSLDVETLVSLGRQPWTGHLGRLTNEDRKHVTEAMEQAGAIDLRQRSVSELSDGECQKVLIARAFAQHTPVMLLDEPTAFLDLTNRVRIVRLLRDIARSTGRAVLFSTHDLQLALDLADRLVVIRRDRTLWQGAPHDAIVQGILATEFDDAQVRFDAATGAFRAV